MPNYDFSTLNDKDLEELVRDLLQRKWGFMLESFKKGQDKGIDLRYSKPTGGKNNLVVVQVKDYRKSGVTKLKSDLKLKELPKVKLLNPSRYVVATSVGLSPEDKESIRTSFDPYIKSDEDILGQDDLNNLLGLYPEVEKQY